MEEVNKLVLARGQIKARLTRFKTYFNKFEDGDEILQLKLRLNKFEPSYDEFDKIQSQIEMLDASDHQINERNVFETSYFNIITRAEKLIERNSISLNTTQATTSSSLTTSQIKLPTIELPSFNGTFDQWTPFYDTFTSLIHNNSNLSEIQKFHYLRSTLKGTAIQVTQSLTISAENYAIAWNLLKERYENKRIIIQNHIKALFELPVVAKESTTALRELHDGYLKHIRALTALNLPTDQWDALTVHLISSKFDPVTRREWESTTTSDILPTAEELTQFLTHRCQLLEALDSSNPPTKINQVKPSSHQPNTRKFNNYNSNKPSSSTNVSSYTPTCHKCQQSHEIFQCSEFLNLSVNNRIKEVKRLNLCLNCLKPGHLTNQCNSGSCRTCFKKHNSLLHIVTTAASNQQQPQSPSTSEVIIDTDQDLQRATTTVTHHCQNATQVLLSTAMIEVFDTKGIAHECRALLDAGSQSNFITTALCQKLNLKCKSINLPVTGINQSNITVNQTTQLKLKSRLNSYKTNLSCLVLPRITQNLPLFTFNASQFEIPSNIKLADPQFHISRDIDMLIGAEIFWDLLCIGQIKSSYNQPTLHKTHFGWIVGGRTISQDRITSPQIISCNVSSESLHNQMEKFWKIEEVQPVSHQTAEEQECEVHYINTVKRDPTGRYVVKLPMRDNLTLGQSRDIAHKRFIALEKSLQRHPDLQLKYIQFMDEYAELNHMIISNEETSESNENFYLPHHPVSKQIGDITKIRVVFDGSCKSRNGLSLNDKLLVGATVQQDLYSILARFRTHKFVITADIIKMYRQINVQQEDTRFQRILWRRHPDDVIQAYDLNTVTYGTASAPFLATRTLNQLAADELHWFPTAAAIVLRDFYVDDLLTGANTQEEAIALRDELIALLSRGQFALSKWLSNHEMLLENIPKEDTISSLANLDKDSTTKILGMQWNSSDDTFRYAVKQPTYTFRITKRTILSTISQLFDPLGLVGPVIVKAKMLMQTLWQLKTGWDESIPAELHTTWNMYKNGLSALQELKIPRHVLTQTIASELQLHGFCDPSENAYGACLYIRSSDSQGNHNTLLLCAKSRIAPVKRISLPRLELCGALLLCHLVQKTSPILDISIQRTYLWTDSTIVLAWISSPSRNWKTFVSNRVAEIQELSNIADWNHIRTHDNPADIISRGMMPHLLNTSCLWWNGPPWLSDEAETWPIETGMKPLTEIPEIRTQTQTYATTTQEFNLIQKYSSYSKLQRITAWCLRFIHNSRNFQKHTGFLTPHELQQSSYSLAKIAQLEFHQEINDLRKHGEVKSKSNIISLSPFLDHSDILRVGGRLKNANLSYEQRHPILLPASHSLTKLLVSYEHIRQLHAGPQATLASLRTKYWPINGRNVTRFVIKNCMTCYRMKPKEMTQIMGNSPFVNCGIDYCGPINIYEGQRRGRRLIKTYIAVFVCFATKAVHLELVGNLTTESFLAALKRFMARRGKVLHIYSDNATNFVGANNELRELSELFHTQQHQERVSNALVKDNITWHFIPPRSPHFGGLWEAAVKSTKHHLLRVVGNTSLTYEELTTLLTQVEACLNSRPLTPLTTDPTDLTILTPAHFLIGDSLTTCLEPDLRPLKINTLSRWQYTQQLLQHFWARWSREYLSQLQQRRRWQITQDNDLQPGRMVVLKDENLHPLQWKLGRILEAHPGKDDFIRVVTVKTSSGVLKRAINKLCILPIDFE